MKLAVIKTGGKQYLVKENDEIYVDRLPNKENDKLELETLALFNSEGDSLDLGAPSLKTKVEAQLVTQLKANKIRVAKFKAKVRYRRVKGFRHQMSKVKILKI